MQARTTGLSANWALTSSLGLAMSVNRQHQRDSRNNQRTLAFSADGQLTWSFLLRRPWGPALPGQFFLRWNLQRNGFIDHDLGIDQDGHLWLLASGLTFSFQEPAMSDISSRCIKPRVRRLLGSLLAVLAPVPMPAVTGVNPTGLNLNRHDVTQCYRTTADTVQAISCPNVTFMGQSIGTFPSARPARDKCVGTVTVAGVTNTTEHDPGNCPAGFAYRQNHQGNTDRCVQAGQTQHQAPNQQFQASP
jgi:hypothetical protein